VLSRFSGGFPDLRLSTNGPQSTGKIRMGRFRMYCRNSTWNSIACSLARVAVVLFDDRLPSALGEKIVKARIDLRPAQRSLEGLPRETESFGPSIVRGAQDDERGLSPVDLEIISGAVGAETSFGGNVRGGERLRQVPVARSFRKRLRESFSDARRGFGVSGSHVRRYAKGCGAKRLVLRLLARGELFRLEKALLGEE
jgi:hypothetical protein